MAAWRWRRSSGTLCTRTASAGPGRCPPACPTTRRLRACLRRRCGTRSRCGRNCRFLQPSASWRRGRRRATCSRPRDKSTTCAAASPATSPLSISATRSRASASAGGSRTACPSTSSTPSTSPRTCRSRRSRRSCSSRSTTAVWPCSASWPSCPRPRCLAPCRPSQARSPHTRARSWRRSSPSTSSKLAVRTPPARRVGVVRGSPSLTCRPCPGPALGAPPPRAGAAHVWRAVFLSFERPQSRTIRIPQR
mmetsp:Transcript_11494/g.29442  ORF Transcript_11494/g.29442 Transcript_11494/m.29442 type:complete len:250 (+) Transcript_11494:276-1025(+)